MLRQHQTIGPYTLVRALGQGAFGVVWLAERRGLITTQVALKIPREPSDAIIAEVTAEAQVWQRASGHPNVLPVIEASIYDNLVVIVSEYAADGNLEEWLAQHGGRADSVERAVRLSAGILAGLEHLHRMQIVHRDLKPANVMLQGDTPRLTDFGLARGASMRQTNHITGTLHYMAPEMFDGDYSPQSDIWAAGVILYELLSGDLPYPQKRVEMLITATLSSPPAPLPDEILEGIRRVVMRALARKPEERFGSAEEMRVSLLRALAEEQAPISQVGVSVGPAAQTNSAGEAPQVVILYKRDSPPDEHLLHLLERALLDRGFRVFIDRHISIGVRWAEEIERQIRSSLAVVPLISAASVQSEMLAYELKIAQEAMQQAGTPRILPVRVGYTEPLRGELADMLNPIQYALWSGAEDDGELVEQMLQSLGSGQPEPQRPFARLPEAVGGAVQLDSGYWIVRPTELQFRQAVARHDSIVLLKGARQMGKTSLLARGLQQARSDGAQCIRSDFQKLNNADLESIDTLFQALMESIADQLDIDYDPDRHWNPRRGANANLERFLRREVLRDSSRYIFWAMDEVDRLFSYAFGSEVFGLFRSWHNERSLEPDGPWARLTLAIAYATEAHLFISDLNQSPFNVGTRLMLEDLTPSQVSELNERYGCPLRNAAELERFQRLLNGQPYLTQRGLSEMVSQRIGFSEFESIADQEEGLFGDHLRRFLVLLVRDDQLCDAMRAALRGQPIPGAEAFYKLRSAGLIAGESIGEARPRCLLYRLYLERHLL